MLKKWMTILLGIAMLMGVACAEGPVLLVKLPDEAQMIENIEFDDGDFIQTYQLPEGVSVKVLRYASFDMTLEDLAEGEWNGYLSAEPMGIESIDGFAAHGLRVRYEQEGMYDVYMIRIDVQDQVLLFEAVFPESISSEAAQQISAWIQEMRISGIGEEDLG